MYDDDDDERMIPFLSEGGPGHADLNALDDVVNALRACRMAAWRYQEADLPVVVDAPSGVLEDLERAEASLTEAMSMLAVSIASEQNIEG